MASEHIVAAPRAAVGLGVVLRASDSLAAEDAFRIAMASEQVVAMAGGAFGLGVVLAASDPVAAAAAYRVAIASDHADFAPQAALNLGLLLTTVRGRRRLPARSALTWADMVDWHGRMVEPGISGSTDAKSVPMILLRTAGSGGSKVAGRAR
jgi:hypothetical protein